MVHIKRWATTAALALALTACATAPKTGHEAETTKTSTQIREAAEKHSLKISVNMATTLRGQPVRITPDYGIELHGDSIRSYLPYYGRAYSVPTRNESALDFDGRMDDYTVTDAGKGTTRIEFETRTTDDLFRFRIDIYNNGNATVKVTPQQRDRITFDGEVDEPL